MYTSIYTFCNLPEFSLSPLGLGADRVEPRLDFSYIKPAKNAKSCFFLSVLGELGGEISCLSIDNQE